MRLTQIFTVLIFFFLFNFCKKKDTVTPETPAVPNEILQPKASFTVSKHFPKIGESVKFTNTSTDSESFEWDFGDGQTSSEKSPEHIYNSKGKYNVTLKAKSGDNSALLDTFVYCDMLASIGITFSFNSWFPPKEWPIYLNIEYNTDLYKYPDTTKSLASNYASYSVLDYQKQYNVRYSLPDEFSTYIVKCRVVVIGWGSGPDPNADYVFKKTLGVFYTETFNTFNAPVLITKTKKIGYININYFIAPIEYH